MVAKCSLKKYMEEEKKVDVARKSNKVGLMIVIILIVLVVVGYFAFKNNKSISSIVGQNVSVATVNGVAISKATFDDQLATAITSYTAQGVNATSTAVLAQIKAQVLDNLINNEVLNQAVKVAGIVASSTQADAQYQALVTQAGGLDKLQTQLTQSNMTMTQLKDNISKQLAAQAYLMQNINTTSITASDAEVAQFYAQYSSSLKAAGQTVPALSTLSDKIKQQIILNKEQALVSNFVAGLRAKAAIATSTNL